MRLRLYVALHHWLHRRAAFRQWQGEQFEASIRRALEQHQPFYTMMRKRGA